MEGFFEAGRANERSGGQSLSVVGKLEARMADLRHRGLIRGLEG